MEPVMVYVVVMLQSVVMVSTEAVPEETCKTLQRYNPGMLCVEREADCGIASGNEPCKGPVYDAPTKTYARKKR